MGYEKRPKSLAQVQVGAYSCMRTKLMERV